MSPRWGRSGSASRDPWKSRPRVPRFVVPPMESGTSRSLSSSTFPTFHLSAPDPYQGRGHRSGPEDLRNHHREGTDPFPEFLSEGATQASQGPASAFQAKAWKQTEGQRQSSSSPVSTRGSPTKEETSFTSSRASSSATTMGSASRICRSKVWREPSWPRASRTPRWESFADN